MISWNLSQHVFLSFSFHIPQQATKTPQKAEFFRGLFKGLWLLFVVVACSFIYLTTRFESKPTGAFFAGEKNHRHTWLWLWPEGTGLVKLERTHTTSPLKVANEREIPLFQLNLAWWNIILWADRWFSCWAVFLSPPVRSNRIMGTNLAICVLVWCTTLRYVTRLTDMWWKEVGVWGTLGLSWLLYEFVWYFKPSMAIALPSALLFYIFVWW